MKKHTTPIIAIILLMMLLAFYLDTLPPKFLSTNVGLINKKKDAAIQCDTVIGEVLLGKLSATYPNSDANRCPLGQRWHSQIHWTGCVLLAGCWPQGAWDSAFDKCVASEGSGYLTPNDPAEQWPNEFYDKRADTVPVEYGHLDTANGLTFIVDSIGIEMPALTYWESSSRMLCMMDIGLNDWTKEDSVQQLKDYWRVQRQIDSILATGFPANKIIEIHHFWIPEEDSLFLRPSQKGAHYIDSIFQTEFKN